MKDKELWQKYTEKVKPLSQDAERIDHSEVEPPLPEREDFGQKAPLPQKTPDYISPFDPDRPADIDKNYFTRLKKGKILIEATLDLHGCTHEQAFRLVHQQLKQWQAHGKRCVLVITGKGLRSEDPRNTLKSRFPEWLNQSELRSLMIAYCQAQPKDGGSGAFYVLLKARKK